jgi:hypothetical protein
MFDSGQTSLSSGTQESRIVGFPRGLWGLWGHACSLTGCSIVHNHTLLSLCCPVLSCTVLYCTVQYLRLFMAGAGRECHIFPPVHTTSPSKKTNVSSTPAQITDSCSLQPAPLRPIRRFQSFLSSHLETLTSPGFTGRSISHFGLCGKTIPVSSWARGLAIWSRWHSVSTMGLLSLPLPVKASSSAVRGPR